MDYFNNLFGHEEIKESINRAFDTGRLHHALMICGIDGIGKRSLSNAIARKLLSENSANPEKTLSRIENGTHEDLIVVDINWGVKNPGSTIKVEAIRELESRIHSGPFESDSLVVIIDSAIKMTTQSANALLKTLEEPPGGTYLLLLAPSPDAVLPTIRSRCQIYHLKPLSIARMRQFAAIVTPQLTEKQSDFAIDISQGSPGIYKEFTGSEMFIELSQLVEKMIESVISGNLRDIFTLTDRLSSLDAENMIKVFDLFQFRISRILKNGPVKRNPPVNADKWYETLVSATGSLKTNVNKRLFFEQLLWTMRRT
ncbi:MAG: DNA polymerase III subunit [Deltaproteobacteria bacterium]|nr:DNA polymerase III subunit [Deltaproteobacteria bacterium]